MANLAVVSQEATLNLRLDVGLKAAFMDAAESEDRAAAEVLRELMGKYVEQVRRRRFRAEARRQSLLLAESPDEIEVMRWIEDVTAIGKSE